MPEVGLELSSSPCKHWEPAETYGIRSSPRTVSPDPRAKMWTMSTPRFPPLKPPTYDRIPKQKGCGFFFVLKIGLALQQTFAIIDSATFTFLEAPHAEPQSLRVLWPDLIFAGHAARFRGFDGQAEVQTACHSDMSHDRWAGPPRNQGATAPTPNRKLLHQTSEALAADKVFAPWPVPQVALRPLSPAGGPLPERHPQPTTAENTATPG